ncbi:NERD domain-containing protein [Neptunomonas antarctica]|uniref:UvrD-like helicase C-terminal domain-containing protein n=1 Tax=Neptunomonas antarctica TaxID=619304 RepID=A0A1N7IVW5_9GAMM|nr:NERD domain-containing protein [Neptunomonas antarctica]SIS41210.1 UvrD-like helicase C-terminal domain-containing protein [Neptunomonas antarctica]
MPRVIGPVPSDRWEREVRRQLLKQLPDKWIVVCNVSWALKNEMGSVRDGQADFVILAPELGLAVVEVKGSKSVRVDAEGKWYRIAGGYNGKSSEILLKEPPPEQATRNLHTLTKVVKEELSFGENAPFPGLHAWLVVYPNGEVEGKLDTYDQSTIVTKKRMHQLGSVISGALLAKGGEATGKKFSQELADRAAEILTNQRFRVVAVDTELDTYEDEKDIDELTRQQFAALRGAFELPRVAIIGPAGSGKTLLAIWKLSALLEEGQKAIFVCFNKALAESLRIKHPSMANAIVSIDSLFWRIVDDHAGSSEKDFYSKVLPERVLDALYSFKDDDKYDAIIIDEGQDFGDDRIVALYHLLEDSDNSQWLYFADSKQDLYGQGTNETLGAEVTFRLYHNCRNTERVNAATNKVCSGEVKSMPGMPSGEIPHVSICKADFMAQKAWSLVNELSSEGGAVILSPFKLENSCMNGSKKAYGLELTEDISKLGQPGFVFYSTIKSFKGLEARHVVFVHADKPGMNPALADEDLYVAFTRATARLDVVTTNREAESWLSGLLMTLA